MVRPIIFDFDGVILESVSAKTAAFRALFSYSPEHIDEIVRFHLDNGGMSRFDKFRYIYREILKEELTGEEFDTLSRKFAALVFDEVMRAPYVPGAYEILERWHTKIPLYVISATPEEELVRIINQRGMAHYFRKVFGAPRKKTDCIREIVSLTGSPREEIIFIGDARNDYEAARTAGIRFIGRVKPGDKNRFEGLTGIEAKIPDLHELARYVEVNC